MEREMTFVDAILYVAIVVNFMASCYSILKESPNVHKAVFHILIVIFMIFMTMLLILRPK